MSRLETQIAEALTAYIDTELHSAVQDQVCLSDIANEIDLDDLVQYLDIDSKFDDAINNWIESNFETIAEQYRQTARYVVESMGAAQMQRWLLENAHRFDPLHRRCWRWVTLVCKNKLTWRKKDD